MLCDIMLTMCVCPYDVNHAMQHSHSGLLHYSTAIWHYDLRNLMQHSITGSAYLIKTQREVQISDKGPDIYAYERAR